MRSTHFFEKRQHGEEGFGMPDPIGQTPGMVEEGVIDGIIIKSFETEGDMMAFSKNDPLPTIKHCSTQAVLPFTRNGLKRKRIGFSRKGLKPLKRLKTSSIQGTQMGQSSTVSITGRPLEPAKSTELISAEHLRKEKKKLVNDCLQCGPNGLDDNKKVSSCIQKVKGFEPDAGLPDILISKQRKVTSTHDHCSEFYQPASNVSIESCSLDDSGEFDNQLNSELVHLCLADLLSPQGDLKSDLPIIDLLECKQNELAELPTPDESVPTMSKSLSGDCSSRVSCTREEEVSDYTSKVSYVLPCSSENENHSACFIWPLNLIPVTVLDIGCNRPIKKEIVEKSKLMKKNSVVIDKTWAVIAASALQRRSQTRNITRLLVPVKPLPFQNETQEFSEGEMKMHENNASEFDAIGGVKTLPHSVPTLNSNTFKNVKFIEELNRKTTAENHNNSKDYISRRKWAIMSKRLSSLNSVRNGGNIFLKNRSNMYIVHRNVQDKKMHFKEESSNIKFTALREKIQSPKKIVVMRHNRENNMRNIHIVNGSLQEEPYKNVFPLKILGKLPDQNYLEDSKMSKYAPEKVLTNYIPQMSKLASHNAQLNKSSGQPTDFSKVSSVYNPNSSKTKQENVIKQTKLTARKTLCVDNLGSELKPKFVKNEERLISFDGLKNLYDGIKLLEPDFANYAYIWCSVHSMYHCPCNKNIFFTKNNFLCDKRFYQSPPTFLAISKIFRSSNILILNSHDTSRHCARTKGSIINYSLRNCSSVFKDKRFFDIRHHVLSSSNGLIKIDCTVVDTVKKGNLSIQRDGNISFSDLKFKIGFEQKNSPAKVSNINVECSASDVEKYVKLAGCNTVSGKYKIASGKVRPVRTSSPSRPSTSKINPLPSDSSTTESNTPNELKVKNSYIRDSSYGLLCRTKGIGYLPIYNYSPNNKLWVKDPAGIGLRCFRDLKCASDWLNEYLKQNIIFEDASLSLEWIVVMPNLKKKFSPFDKSMFGPPKSKVLDKNGVLLDANSFFSRNTDKGVQTFKFPSDNTKITRTPIIISPKNRVVRMITSLSSSKDD